MGFSIGHEIAIMGANVKDEWSALTRPQKPKWTNVQQVKYDQQVATQRKWEKQQDLRDKFANFFSGNGFTLTPERVAKNAEIKGMQDYVHSRRKIAIEDTFNPIATPSNEIHLADGSKKLDTRS